MARRSGNLQPLPDRVGDGVQHPVQAVQRYASHEGGIADAAIISWPAGIAAHGEVRDTYVNVCDITPTVYDLLGINAPDTVKGIPQRPLDGVSFKAALSDSTADTGKQTQFYTMLGTRGSGTTGGSPIPCTPRHRRAGRTSTPTAGSCSTWRPTAASAATWLPSIRTSWRSSRRCGTPRRPNTTAFH